MTFKDYCALSDEQRLNLLNKELEEVNGEIPFGPKIIYKKWEEWRIKELPAEERISLFSKLREDNGKTPKIIFEIFQEWGIKELPTEERLWYFNKSKEEWNKLYPDFKRISDIMENFKTNELLVEYTKHSPPPSIHNKAIQVYKKCISFKEKFTKQILTQLAYHPERSEIHRSYAKYCIDKIIVKAFLNEYQLWNYKICSLWNDVHYLKQDFFSNSGYKNDWTFYIKYPNSLKSKADETEKLHEQITELINAGKELVFKHDKAITLEYEENGFEMSLYERELEILQSQESDNASDEEYCYVYTLECELFVFYVGIAANPKERFEQHIRGAFSDESHLFKSKFIQKYHNEVKQNIIHEGKRRECKQFEKEYIAKFSPLGNMTEGGEG